MSKENINLSYDSSQDNLCNDSQLSGKSRDEKSKQKWLNPNTYFKILKKKPPLPPPPPLPPSKNDLNVKKSRLSNEFVGAIRRVSMKPLFWSRIFLKDAIRKDDPIIKNTIWAEIKSTKNDNNLNFNIEEFFNLFSKDLIKNDEKMNNKMNNQIKKDDEKMFYFDNKKLMMIEILEKHLREDYETIKNAIYNMDTNILSYDLIVQIYKFKPTDDEIKKIIELENLDDDNKNKIELSSSIKFLKCLSEIKFLSERLSCIIFQEEFEDLLYSISQKLTVFCSVCDFLLESNSLKKIFFIILTLGNYMNANDPIRGEAGGFSLEILNKLKDVKSKIPNMSLLHYIVKVYLKQTINDKQIYFGNLPVPEPDMIYEAARLDFKEIDNQLGNVSSKLQDCEKKYTTIVTGDYKNSKNFQHKYRDFLTLSNEQLNNERKIYLYSIEKFIKVIKFYYYDNSSNFKKNNNKIPPPQKFFENWMLFCKDFKDIWNKEIELKRQNDVINELKKNTEHSKWKTAINKLNKQ